jgi:peptidyl-prolyl cis-trans isomerase SurA
MPRPRSWRRREHAAHDIDDRAHNGEDFGKLAITYSQSETALEGGSLGWRKGTELPTFLADVVARMKPGDVSDVLQTPSGFHIVKLNDRALAGGPQIIQQVHLRHILIKPTEIEDDATVRQKLTRCAIRSSRQGGLRGAGQDQFAGSGLGRSMAATWAGPSPSLSCPNSPAVAPNLKE